MAIDKRTNLEMWRAEYSGEDDKQKLAAIEKAATDFGEAEIVVVDMTKPEGEIAIFRTPTPGEHARFTASILSDKGDAKARASEIMARNCVVYPDRNMFGSWCDKWPAIGPSVLKMLMRLAGGETKERGKE